MEGTDRLKDAVTSSQLAQLAASAGSLRLVFLNACQGAKTSEVDRLGGVAMALAQKGIPASIVGELTAADKGMVLVEGGREKPLEHPIVDPFWRAFYGALENTPD